jgi:pSer/pThr/pTyr-binding forkhead associated (FHA) protein
MTGLPLALRRVSPAELARRLDVERRGIPFLVYLGEDGEQRIVELGGAAVSIGRQASAGIPLHWDTEVSRVHAVLEPAGQEWTIVDDGLSRNGTFVNGERLRGRRRLAHGDAILIGRTVLAFAGGGRAESRTTTAVRTALPPLSPAQTRVLEALCRPLMDHRYAGPPSNRQIAGELFLSVETVKRHMHDLFDLFGVADLPQNRKRSELARRAIAMGVVRTASAGSVPGHAESSL